MKSKKIAVKVISCIISLVMMLSMSACANNADFSKYSGYKFVYPEKISGHLDNPGMGWVGIEETINLGQVELGAYGDFPEVSVISIESSWAYLEPNKDEYDFDMLDSTINYWISRGKRINFRIMTDALVLGFTKEGAPSWLLEDDRVGYEIVELVHDGSNVFDSYKVANVKSEYYQERLKIFLNKLVEKYGDLDDLETVEVRGYGCWGEWHSGHSFNSMNERVSTLQQIFDVYSEAWTGKGKCLVVSNTWDPTLLDYYENSYDAYYSSSVLDYVMQTSNGSYRRDAVASSLFKNNLEGRLMRAFLNSGKKYPLCAEFYYRIEDMENSSEDGYNALNSMNEMLYRARANYCSIPNYNLINLASALEDGFGEYIDYANEKMGYRLAVDEARFNEVVSFGDVLNVRLKISNSGVGRFWFDDFIKYYIKDSDGNIVYSFTDTKNDLRNLLLGESNEYFAEIKLPSDIKKGEYTLAVAIVTQDGNPHIRLAQTGDHNTKIYDLGTFGVSDNVAALDLPEYKTDYNGLKNYCFEKNSVYTVTFGYTPHFDVADYMFNVYYGYEVRLKTKDGNVNQLISSFQDVSQEYGSKTIVFDTGNKDNYYLDIDSVNLPELSVENVYIRKETNGVVCNFDNEGNIFNGVNSTSTAAVVKNEDCINGASLLIENKAKGLSCCAALNSKKIKLKSKTSYTVAFNSKTIKEVGIGGYMALILKSDENEFGREILTWYDGIEENNNYYTVTFTTDDAENNSLFFGLFNSGGYVVDDFVIVENAGGLIIDAKEIGHQRNCRPQKENRIGQIEDFEDEISLLNTNFSWGFQRWGKLTKDENLVISGNTSFHGVVPIGHTTGDWMEFCYTNESFIRLKPNTTYELEFEYKIISHPVTSSGENGFFYIVSRSNSLFTGDGTKSDCYYNEFSRNVEAGNVFKFSASFTTGNATDFKIAIGQYGFGEIIMDNFKIVEK